MPPTITLIEAPLVSIFSLRNSGGNKSGLAVSAAEAVVAITVDTDATEAARKARRSTRSSIISTFGMFLPHLIARLDRRLTSSAARKRQ